MPFLGSLIAGVGSVVSTVAPIVGAYQSIAALTPRPTVTPQPISWMQPTPFYRNRYYTPSYGRSDIYMRGRGFSPRPGVSVDPGYLGRLNASANRRLSIVQAVPSADDFAGVSADAAGDKGWH